MKVWLRACWAAAVVIAALPAWGGPAGRSALIVGVSTYASPEITPLAGVPFDIDSARAIARAMGIPDQRMTVLRDAQATKAAILEALERMAASVEEGGRAFIYFSGHGTRWFDRNVRGCKEGLLAYDRGTITNEEIAQRTRRMSEVADKVVVLFDACHSDGVSTGARAITRSMAQGTFTPKFFLKGGEDERACSQPTNIRTRSLLTESTKLGALKENFVQITSARADEVSFDEPGKGGLATQGVRQCLLSRSADRDGSGSTSVAEIEACAQQVVNDKLKPFPDLRPHQITVTGNCNIVPVAVVRPPAPAPVAITAPTPTPTPAPAPAPTVPALPQPPAPPPEPGLASLAALRDIEQQRNPRRRVEVKLSTPAMRIGRDQLQLSVTSSHAGHVYLLMLGSDRKSFYLLFPNGLDGDNRIQAGRTLTLPRPDWALMARGPEGENHLLVMVTDTPRDTKVLSTSAPSAAAPFTFALNDLEGRSGLLDFFIGRGVTGTSESFGAQLLTIREVP